MLGLWFATVSRESRGTDQKSGNKSEFEHHYIQLAIELKRMESFLAIYYGHDHSSPRSLYGRK